MTDQSVGYRSRRHRFADFFKSASALPIRYAISLFLFAGACFAFPVSASEIPMGAPGWQPDARAFLFGVPFFRQQHALSCETASLRSALAGIGIRKTEEELWRALPKDPTPQHWLVPGRIIVWGDPNIGFVGNRDGRMPQTGYGVFAGPVSRAANVFASSTVVRLDDPRVIDNALRQGHPIIAWITTGDRPSVTKWTAPDGKTVIHAPLYEHTVVIIGYRGRGDFIEGLYVIDPLTGMEYQTWDTFHFRASFFNYAGVEVGDSRVLGG